MPDLCGIDLVPLVVFPAFQQEIDAGSRRAARAGGAPGFAEMPAFGMRFKVQGGEYNHWHKVDAAEIWHFYAGAPLILSVSETDTGPATDMTLGPDLATGQNPQVIIPENHWQKATCTGNFTLVGCTVSPGFEFENFVLAEPGFDIPR